MEVNTKQFSTLQVKRLHELNAPTHVRHVITHLQLRIHYDPNSLFTRAPLFSAQRPPAALKSQTLNELI
jgi:hypothetical protein